VFNDFQGFFFYYFYKITEKEPKINSEISYCKSSLESEWFCDHLKFAIFLKERKRNKTQAV